VYLITELVTGRKLLEACLCCACCTEQWCVALLHMRIQVYLITELVTGGELLEAVLQRGSYSEGEARLAFVQLLRGIQYLHSK
jgi:serine/threonine protein kinase